MHIHGAKEVAMNALNTAIPRYAGKLVILDDATIETPDSWVFVFAHQELLRTKDRRYVLFGSNAIEIAKDGADRGLVSPTRLRELRGR